ncbi:MAG: VOC family protein [Oceanococcus sp.]
MASKIDALAYIVAQSTDVSKWQDYAENVLGMSTSPAPAGGLYLKMDERDFRMLVVQGDEDRYLASGWQVADAAALGQVKAALEGAGATAEAASAEDCSVRRVEQMLRFTDPSGNAHEVSCGYNGSSAAFTSPIGVDGFVTGDMGMGHTVLPALAMDDTLKFFTEVLGFGVSDVFDFVPPVPDAPTVRIRFLYAGNGRHHSLALAEMPDPSGCVHAMVEVNSMTDVGKAYDRRAQSDAKLMATLGQHCNDHMTSFYMKTPSGFALEYGWGGITVDVDNHQTTTSEAVSIWGHDFSIGFQ